MNRFYVIVGVLVQFSLIVGLEILAPPIFKVLDNVTSFNNMNIGVVPGAKSCGGPGQFIQWRYETCEKQDVPCRVPADSSIHQAELDFISSKDLTSLGLRVKLQSQDGLIEREFNYPGPAESPAALQEGQTYTIANAGGIGEKLGGKLGKFQYILYDMKTNDVELCAEADFLYW